MFKIRYVNKEIIDTTSSISSVVGKAFHKAMEVYYGGSDDHVISDEADALKYGLEVGTAFLETYNDGFISFSKDIANKQKAIDRFVFAFNSYIRENKYVPDELVSIEEKLEELVNVEWKRQNLSLPIPLKGYTDKIIRNKKGMLCIVDYKCVSRCSDPDRIDGSKIVQAVTYFLLVYAKYGEKPYSMIFEEVKNTKNMDGTSQVKKYELVFEDNELFFDFFFRLYDDLTRALLGEAVFVPNIHTLFDNEISIISYIQRLDETEETAKLMKKHKVKSITEVLKKEIHAAKSMRSLLKQVEKQFISAKNLNYSNMTNEEKIATKLLEHGMMLQFDSKIEGATVDLYRYTPSIGLKMSRIESYSADIEQVLGMSGIRVLAPIQNSTMVGFEVPRQVRVFPEISWNDGTFEVAIGQDIMGRPYVFDIRTAPHLLVAGTTGSGKSIFLKSILKQIGDVASIWIMDPKGVDLTPAEVRSDRYTVEPKEIMVMLKTLTDEMDERYKDIREGNKKKKAIIAVIDEYADLMLQTRDGFEEWEFCKRHEAWDRKGDLTRLLHSKRKLRVKEQDMVDDVTYCEDCIKHMFPPASESILRLAQKGRAAGIHVILATQRPSTDIITGVIKANFPTKVCLKTSTSTDSLVVLGDKGAEKLQGKGDLLFQSDAGTIRLQGYITK